MFAGGFASGLIATGGDLSAGFASGLSALAFFGIGQAFGSVDWSTPGKMLSKTLVHGLAGGALSRAQGGSFRSGFLGSAFAQATGNVIGKIRSAAGRVVAAAILGGTAAKLGGGKFANGAVSGAFVQALNHELSREQGEQPADERNLSADGESGSIFTGEEIEFAGDGAISTTCGPGPVSCIANDTGGDYAYDDGDKLATYTCHNSGGSCSFQAPSSGEHVYGGAGWRDLFHDGKLGGAYTRVEPFTVNPDSLWDRYIRYNPRFIDALREVQRSQ